MSPSRRRPLAWLSALAAVCLVLLAWCLPGLATRWLLTGEPPVKSDLLLVLAGGSHERTQTALALYKAGMAPAILYTGASFPEGDFIFLAREGVPLEALHAPRRVSDSTFEDALSLRQFVLDEGVKSVLIVTSPYHCRRVQLVFSRVMSGLGTRLTVTPSESLYMDPEKWWKSRQGWITAGLEFPKIGWSWLTVTPIGNVGPGGSPN